MNKDRIKEMLMVEEDFFELDKEKKIAKMKLHFPKPSSIFDENSLTKTPMLSDDFFDWVKLAIQYPPRNYKLDLDISFDDMEGYTSEALQDIFEKNVALEFKRLNRETNSKNLLAMGLILIGVLFFVLTMIMNRLWTGENLAKEIISYVADIATTVTFWEALTILVVENKEKRDSAVSLAKRFGDINFHKKEE